MRISIRPYVKSGAILLLSLNILNLQKRLHRSVFNIVTKADVTFAPPSEGLATTVDTRQQPRSNTPLLMLSHSQQHCPGPFTNRSKRHRRTLSPLESNNTSDSFMRACLLVRDDNHLLWEWVAYHYTVLPLRHLIIGCDENAVEDPMDVLEHWKGTDLTYDVWHSQNFTQSARYEDHHNAPHRYVLRQAHFYGRCLQYFLQQGHRGWVALIDTDEYIQLNPLDDNLDRHMFGESQGRSSLLDANVINETSLFMSPNETLWDRISERKRLRKVLRLDQSGLAVTTRSTPVKQQQPIPTVLKVLDDYTSKHGSLACHIMPRLRYSAVADNLTSLARRLCRPQLDPTIFSAARNATNQLSTIRFLHHVPPNRFEHNGWGKVLVHLGSISFKSLRKMGTPHKPLPECVGPPYIPNMASFLRVNHYINDFHLFTKRKGDARRQQGGGRRQRVDWSKSAHARDRATCDHMYGWLNQFVNQFGIVRAQQLLQGVV